MIDLDAMERVARDYSDGAGSWAYNKRQKFKTTFTPETILDLIAAARAEERARVGATVSEMEIVQVAAPPPPVEVEPVAWRVKDFADGWICTDDADFVRGAVQDGVLVQPLYTRPTEREG
jgi:hypothetical protein